MDMVADLHGPDFDWYPLYFSPGDCGFTGVARHRVYVIGCNTKYSHCLHDPHELKEHLTRAVSRQTRDCPCRVRDFLISSKTDVCLEAAELANRRGMTLRPREKDLTYLLLPREVAALDEYEKEYMKRYGRSMATDPDLIIFLGDSPHYSLTWSASSGNCPTFRMKAKTGIYWLPSVQRFLTSREKLCMLGWPVHPRLAEALKVPEIPAQDVGRAAAIAGNSMHVFCVATAQLIALSCFGPLF